MGLVGQTDVPGAGETKRQIPPESHWARWLWSDLARRLGNFVPPGRGPRLLVLGTQGRMGRITLLFLYLSKEIVLAKWVEATQALTR